MRPLSIWLIKTNAQAGANNLQIAHVACRHHASHQATQSKMPVTQSAQVGAPCRFTLYRQAGRQAGGQAGRWIPEAQIHLSAALWGGDDSSGVACATGPTCANMHALPSQVRTLPGVIGRAGSCAGSLAFGASKGSRPAVSGTWLSWRVCLSAERMR